MQHHRANPNDPEPANLSAVEKLLAPHVKAALENLSAKKLLPSDGHQAPVDTK